MSVLDLRRDSSRLAPAVVVLAGLLAAPHVLSSFRLSMFTEVLVFGLAAGSLALLLGITGLPSLGHVAFFGLGAYTAGYVAIHIDRFFLVGTIAAVGIAAVVGAAVGALVIRSHGIYFLMLTLAFAEIVHSGSIVWSGVTGGTNGLTGIPRPMLLPGVEGSVLLSREAVYYYVLVAVLVGYLVLRAVVRSPLGLTLVGIRDNEPRMTALGLNVWWYKLASFTIAAAVGGYAGALYSQSIRFVSPSLLDLKSMVFLFIMPLIIGAHRLAGAFIGAGVVVMVRQELLSRFGDWEIGLGVLLLAIVLLAPREGRRRAGMLNRRKRMREETADAMEEVAA